MNLMKTTTYDVLFLSPLTGTWKLQYAFCGRDHALTCRAEVATLHPSMVFEVVREAGRVVSERQIA
jgi:hypothetical protein